MKFHIATLYALSLLALQNGTGIVTGQLRTSDGSPAAGVRVALMAVETAATAPALTGFAVTDSSGQYRIERIPRGKYYLFAGFIGSPTFYPGTNDLAKAQRVDVIQGVTNLVTFVVEPRSVGLKVSGRVIRSDSTIRVPDVVLENDSTGMDPPTARVAADGSFEFAGIAPGTYKASARVPSGTTLSANVQVVDKNVSGIEVFVPRLIEIQGRVVLEGGGPLPTFSFRMESMAFGQMTYRANTKPDGTFITRLPEGIRFLPDGYGVNQYKLKSFKYGSADLLTDPLRATEGEMIVVFERISPR